MPSSKIFLNIHYELKLKKWSSYRRGMKWDMLWETKPNQWNMVIKSLGVGRSVTHLSLLKMCESTCGRLKIVQYYTSSTWKSRYEWSSIDDYYQILPCTCITFFWPFERSVFGATPCRHRGVCVIDMLVQLLVYFYIGSFNDWDQIPWHWA